MSISARLNARYGLLLCFADVEKSCGWRVSRWGWLLFRSLALESRARDFGLDFTSWVVSLIFDVSR